MAAKKNVVQQIRRATRRTFGAERIPGTPIYEQVPVKSEAVLKRIFSSHLFGVVARDAPDYRIRPGPENCASEPC